MNNIEFVNKSGMNGDDAEAVVENPKLPRMGEESARASRASSKGLKTMEKNPKPDQGGKNRMPEVSETKPKSAKNESEKSEDLFPDQVAKTSAPRKPSKPAQPKSGKTASGADRADSYLRMRVRVENGEISVVDVREVEGPLTMPDTLMSGFAYEVTQGARRVALGSIPDLGEMRSYPNPDGPKEQQGHHVTPLAKAEFNVRVPRAEVSLATLPETEIALYQVKAPVSDKPLARATTLETEFTSEVRELSRLKGIKLTSLSKDAQKEIRRVLK